MSENTLGVWDNIYEMPQWNWQQIQNTGDLKYLFKKCEGKILKEHFELWNDLEEQHIAEFGIPSEVKIRIRKQIKLIQLNAKFIKTKDRVLLNYINIIENELNQKKNEHFGFYDIKEVLEKHKGFRIVCTPNKGNDPNQITVVEWGYALKNLIKYGEANRGQRDNK
jgi:hypothetical protein